MPTQIWENAIIINANAMCEPTDKKGKKAAAFSKFFRKNFLPTKCFTIRKIAGKLQICPEAGF